MLVQSDVSLVFATVLLTGPMVAAATADPVATQSTKSTLCTYRDANYGLNAVICVAPKFGQVCEDGGKWSNPKSTENLDQACANAQIPAPGVPPAQCLYRDVKFALGSLICVAPHFAQECGDNGRWITITPVPGTAYYKACADAQIPIWNPPPASSSASSK